MLIELVEMPCGKNSELLCRQILLEDFKQNMIFE